MEHKIKPLITVCVLAYNQEKYISNAIESAFFQSYDNLEIILSDDNSSDKTFEIISKMANNYKGKAKIIVNKNDTNLGLIKHVNKCLYELSTGDYIALYAGDDISYKSRITDSLHFIEELAVDSISLNMENIDSNSISIGSFFYKDLTAYGKFSVYDFINGKYQQVPGASRMVSRKLINFFGPFLESSQTEDTPLNFRAILYSGIGYSGKLGVKYRRHSNNISSFENLMSYFDPILINKQYLFDLHTAYKGKLISEDQFEKINEILTNNLDRQLLLRKVYNSKELFLKIVILVSIMFSSYEISFKYMSIKIFIKSFYSKKSFN